MTILEFDRDHQREIEVLGDSKALFILTFINDLGNTSRTALSSHLGWPQEEIDRVIKLLANAQLVRDTSQFNPQSPIRLAPAGISMVAALHFPRGRHALLDEIGEILLSDSSPRVLAIAGHSGTGKTSLIRALFSSVPVTEEPADLDLLTEARSGSQAAAEKLFQRYGAFVFRIARSVLRNDADSEDALQRTFLKLLARPFAEIRRPVKPFIQVVAHHTAIDMMHAKLRRHEEPIEGVEVKQQKDVISNWFREEQQAITRQLYVELLANVGMQVERNLIPGDEQERTYNAIRRAVTSLEPDERLLWFHFLEGRSTREIAAELGISESAVRVRQHRALARLRNRLKKSLEDAKRRPSG